MFSIKSLVFSFFTAADHILDPNKNSENKGTNQRFHEMLGAEWDENLLPMIFGLLDNTLNPETMQEQYISYIELMYGIERPLVEEISTRRLFLKYILDIYRVKGTLLSYQLVFKLLGFTDVQIEELSFKQGFDSPVTFDDEQRRFDTSECQTCSYYNLHLTGTQQMTEELYQLILRAVKMVEPINAKLKAIIYNGGEVTFTIFVADNGDLVYSIIGVQISFNLEQNGDLYITAADAQNYFLDNGNLLKNGN